MTSQAKTDFLDLVARDLSAAINDYRIPQEPPASLAGHDDLLGLWRQIVETRGFVLAIANGNLDYAPKQKGYLIGALKTLQAHLRHLTWQTKMVSSGDYSQRVDFMGEFSEAFNAMVEQLKDTMEALQESQDRFRELAITDGLTGLFNRRHFFTTAEMEITRALRYGLPLSIIMMDLDNFKEVNDTYGHETGDNVLIMTAKILRQKLRSVDIVARYGGEEFVIMLPESDKEAALAVAEKIRHKMAQSPIMACNQEVAVTASLGVSHLTSRDEIGADVQLLLKGLIATADKALYQAKEAGRNRVGCFWSDEA